MKHEVEEFDYFTLMMTILEYLENHEKLSRVDFYEMLKKEIQRQLIDDYIEIYEEVYIDTVDIAPIG